MNTEASKLGNVATNNKLMKFFFRTRLMQSRLSVREHHVTISKVAVYDIVARQ